MASLLNNASLLLNPAGSIISYQEDKIYSVLPKDGTGDFTFSGGDGGTRVNQQGYIEQTPVNVYTNSNNFSTWSPKNGTFSQGVADPFGGNNAWVWTATDSDPYLYQNLNLNGIYTVSIYVKGVGSTIGDNLQIRVGGAPYGEFTLTNEWQRFEWSNTLGGFNNIGVEFGNPASIGDVVHVAFAQLNLGSTALPYQPTTDRLNYPRITYQNGRGALLSEPQRTNKQTSSESINGTDYSNNNQITISSDFGISPDGTQNADKIIATTTNDYHQIRTSKATPNGYDIISCFVKASGYNFVQLISWADPADYVNFDLQNGTVGTVSTATIYGIENYGNGWYRIYANVKGSGSGLVGIGIITSATAGWSQAFAGNGTDGILVWGVQIEVGTFPSSYIPTTSATVTRPIDNANKTGISSLIGQTEGVIYFNGTINNSVNAFTNIITSERNTNSSFFFARINSNGQIDAGLFSNGSAVGRITAGNVPNGRLSKIAYAYKSGDSALFINGVQAGSTNTGTFTLPSTLDDVFLDDPNIYFGYPESINYNTTALFNTRLTNTQLQELTTVRSGSGGNISYYGPYTIHTFTGSATFTPSFNGEVEVLVVAGGGGTTEFSGGGGAGGVLYSSSTGVAQGTGYTITIGAGGGGLNGTVTPNNGSNSSAFGLTAIGGGGGASSNFSTIGRNGGSGGGIGPRTGTGGLGIAGQGNNGGDGVTNPGNDGGSGGGGGAGEAGQNGAFRKGGDGGDGLPFSISGYSTYYGGGGAGFGDARNGTSTPGIPGLGGGGSPVTGVVDDTSNTNGVPNTGGGAGAGGPSSTGIGGKTGGSGIVIVRYLT